MCLYLIGSEYKSISEVEQLLNRETCKLSTKQIIAIKDDREAIEKELRVSEGLEAIDALF